MVRQHLLDTSLWPGSDDLAWLRERIRQDHSLSRRVEQLEAFFREVIEKVPPAARSLDGYQSVLQYLEEKEGLLRTMQVERRRLIDDLTGVRDRAKDQSLRTHELGMRVRQLNRRLEELERQRRRLESRAHNLDRQLKGVQTSRTWKVLNKLGRLRAALLGSKRGPG